MTDILFFITNELYQRLKVKDLMSRISYVNGHYTIHQEAHIHIDERGMHFSDGVYEVLFFLDGKTLCLEEHLDRLDFSLRELSLECPVSKPVLASIIDEVIRLNRIKIGAIYVQVARGSAPRAHAFPRDSRPSLIVSVKRAPFVLQAGLPAPASVLTLPDQRWARPDIKSICLLPNVLAKQVAFEEGAFEAVLYRGDGFVTEGSSSNIWIVRPDNVVVTPPADGHILNGITRQVVLDLCRRNGIQAIEYPLTLDDLRLAKEIFLTGTTTFVKPINQVDGVQLSSSSFPVTERIALLYREFCLNHESLNRAEVLERERLCS